MMSLKNSFFLILLFLTISCAKQVDLPFVQSKSEVLKKVKLNNHKICSINKKGIFSYEDNFNKTKFKAFFRKDCMDKFNLTVLGIFNQPVLLVEGNSEELEIVESKLEDTKKYISIMQKENLKAVLKIFNVPLIIPDESYNMNAYNGHIEFSKNGIDIVVNQDYKIIKITGLDFSLFYEYNRDDIRKIVFESYKLKLNVSFL